MPKLDAKIMFRLLLGITTAILYVVLLPKILGGVQAGSQDTLLAFLLGLGGGLWLMLRRQ